MKQPVSFFYNQNLIYKKTMENRLKITEIFHSIQGESTLSGERTTFVRLTGCPLRCTYCDTTYSFTGGEWKTFDDIISIIESHQTKYVCITGGEPLSQKNCLDFVKKLSEKKYIISIETSGEKEIKDYVDFAKIVMDIKTPSSNETAKIAFDNLNYLKPTDEIKFVINDKNDYEWSKTVCSKFNLTSKFKVLFSPVFGTMELKTLTNWILEDKLNVRFQTQLHKHIWGQNTKGV